MRAIAIWFIAAVPLVLLQTSVGLAALFVVRIAARVSGSPSHTWNGIDLRPGGIDIVGMGGLVALLHLVLGLGLWLRKTWGRAGGITLSSLAGLACLSQLGVGAREDVRMFLLLLVAVVGWYAPVFHVLTSTRASVVFHPADPAVSDPAHGRYTRFWRSGIFYLPLGIFLLVAFLTR